MELESKLNMESKPDIHIKRPPNSFMLWAPNVRKDIALCYPDKPNAEISIMLGKIWITLSENTKKYYKDKSILVKEEHRQKHPEYKYTPHQGRKKINNEVKSDKVKIIKDKTFKLSQKPKIQKLKLLSNIQNIQHIDIAPIYYNPNPNPIIYCKAIEPDYIMELENYLENINSKYEYISSDCENPTHGYESISFENLFYI